MFNFKGVGVPVYLDLINGNIFIGNMLPCLNVTVHRCINGNKEDSNRLPLRHGNWAMLPLMGLT